MLKFSKKMISAISLMLVAAIVFSMAGCNKDKKKPANTDKKPGTSVSDNSSDDIGDSDADSENSDLDIDADSKEDSEKSWWDKIVDFFNPNSGKSDSDKKSDGSSSSSSEDNGDDDEGEKEYTAPIQASGEKVEGNARTVTVDTSNVVFEDFMSIGTNMFTAALTSDMQKKYGFNESYFELQKKQIQTLNITTGRLLFCVDWMVTDTEENPSRSDWKNNKDYKNYINGVYDFDNEIMQSMYTYLDAYKEVGTEINLNFGWKNAERISTWFALPTSNPFSSAPRDLDAFANAAAALLDHLVNDKGYTNIKNLTFYNEPVNEYSTIGDKPTYYAHMINKTYAALKKVNLHKKISILAAEHTTIDYNMETSWFDLFLEKCGSNISGFTHHTYYDPGVDVDYNVYFDYYTRIYGHIRTPMLITEYSDNWFSTTVTSKDASKRWNYSDASQLIAAANTGMKGILGWETIGGYAPTVNFYGGGGYSSYFPKDKTSASSTGYFYNGTALINNYVGTYADVLQVNWTGDDIRTSAFKRSDGEYTVIVEANIADSERELTVDFGKKLGKTVYKYTYDYSCGKSGNQTGADSIIPQAVSVYNSVGKTLTDTLSADYRVYIYTTAAPKKQVAFDSVWNECSQSGTISLSARLLDCNSGDKLVWSVASSTGSEKGSVSSTGIYTPASTAKAGDLIAVKAQLKSDSSVYSIVLISIN